MVNANRVAAQIIAALPQDMAPETTSGYQPFIHPVSIQGSVLTSTIKLILRSFSTEDLHKQKKMLESIISDVKTIYSQAQISLSITETYRNMYTELQKYPHITDKLFKAVQKSGITPVWKPIRGGTDGSRLTEMGLPTPNLFTGGVNFHSRTEWLSVDVLVKAIESIINFVRSDQE